MSKPTEIKEGELIYDSKMDRVKQYVNGKWEPINADMVHRSVADKLASALEDAREALQELLVIRCEQTIAGAECMRNEIDNLLKEYRGEI